MCSDLDQSVSKMDDYLQKRSVGMFCGQFIHTVDEKNRIKIPAVLRDELGTKTYCIKSPDAGTKCIYLYSEEGWGRVCEQFNKTEQYNETTRRIARKILSGVVCGEVDKGGRLTLNSVLREYAGISGEVNIYGGINHIEIWSSEEWAKEQALMDEQSTDSLNINF